MKFYITFLFSLLYFINIQAQTWKNLVPNYSFEKVKSSYPYGGAPYYYCGDYEAPGETHYSATEHYWAEVYSWTHLLKAHWWCMGNPAVGTANVLPNFNGIQQARNGDKRGNGTSGEFLVVALKNNGLRMGKTYFVELFHAGSSYSDVRFASGQPRQCNGSKIKPPSSGFMYKYFSTHQGNNWVRTRKYVMGLNTDWMVLGSNGDSGDGHGGGDWDDIRIYEVQPNKCRTNWYFDNTVFNYPNEVFQASNNIYVGNGVDPENGVNHIPGDVIQYSNSKVVLRAGNQVIITNGFIMENPNNVLILENSPCRPTLCPDKLHFENKILCSEPSKVIGPEPNNYGTTVQWSPSTHLSSSTVSNPTFTTPSGTGAIEYTVTVTYECDASVGTQTETHHVVVQYTNSTETSATLTASNTQWDDYNFSTDLNFSQGVTEIKIEVNGSPGYSKTFYKGIDYSCCNFSWSLPNAWKWSSCKNNVVTITAKNKCSDQQSVITLPWNKAATLFSGHPTLPNVVTPNGDNVNDQLCFTLSSADYYSIIVFNRWSTPIYSAYAVEVKNNIICLPEFEDLTDGTYFYMLTLFDNCGNSSANVQFFHVFNSNGLAQSNETDNAQANASRKKNEFYSNSLGQTREQVILIPNPSTDIVEIRGIAEYVKIEVIDNTGKLVPVHLSSTNRIDVSRLAAGLYYVKIISKKTTVIKKLVVL